MRRGTPRWVRRSGIVASWLAAFALFAFPLEIWRRIAERARLENYLRDLNVDDSFYYYTVGRNFAHGHFSTFDGINRTNGFHPLWAWLITPVFWLAKAPLPTLAALKALELALVGLTSFVFAGVAKRLKAPVWFLAPLSLALIPDLTQGLEGATYCCVLALALYTALRTTERRRAKAWLAGVALGAVAWARLEGLAFSVAFLLLLCLLAYCTGAPRKAALRTIAAVAAAETLLYFAYNRLLFQSFLPVSGRTKAFWSEPWVEAHPALLERAKLMFAAARQHQIMAVETGIVVAIVLVSWVVRRYRRPRFRGDHVLDAFMLSVCAAAWARFAYSTLELAPIYATYRWYFAPVYLVHGVLPFYGCARVVRLARIWGRRPAWLALLPATACVLWVSSGHRVQALIALAGQHRKTDWKTASYSGAEWMNENLPKGSVIGAADAGVIGYFSIYPVINLDGLVNSERYFEAQKNGWADRWIAESPINFLANAVPLKATDGCAAISVRARQTGSLPGHCKLVFGGGKFKKHRFYVWSYDR